MWDSVSNFAEGLFLLAMGLRLFEKAKSNYDRTLSILFVFQGVLSVAWALWHNEPAVQRLNTWLPQYIPIIAYLWLAFHARLRKKIA